MAKTGKTNINDYSLEKKSLPKGADTQTGYASAKVLAKAGGSGQGRAPKYELENCKK